MRRSVINSCIRLARLGCTLAVPVICQLLWAQDASDVREQIQDLRKQNEQLQQQLRQQQSLIETLNKKISNLETAVMRESAAAGEVGTKGGFLESLTGKLKGENVVISGEAGLAFFHSDAKGQFRHAEFRVDEAKLFLDAKVWKDVYFFTEVN